MNYKYTISQLLGFSFILTSSPAFAGGLICNYGETSTILPYNYGNNPIVKTLVAPNTLAYTQNCEGISCELVFESFGFENLVLEFNKAKKTEIESLAGPLISCTDTRTDEAVEDFKKETDRLEDQAKRALRKAEEDAKNLGRKLDRGIRGLFN